MPTYVYEISYSYSIISHNDFCMVQNMFWDKCAALRFYKGDAALKRVILHPKGYSVL